MFFRKPDQTFTRSSIFSLMREILATSFKMFVNLGIFFFSCETLKRNSEKLNEINRKTVNVIDFSERTLMGLGAVKNYLLILTFCKISILN